MVIKGSLKVGSLPGMKNNEVLFHFTYKPAESTKVVYLGKFGKIITLCSYIEERGWVNAQILLTNY